MNKMLWKWLRNYFGFNKSETYGVIIIHLAILIMLLVPIILEYALDNSLVLPIEKLNAESTIKPTEIEKSNKIDTVFNFDPNNATLEEFNMLGLPDFLAERVINYRTKVRLFREPEDLYLIYGVDSSWVDRIKPFVTIRQKDPENSPARTAKSSKTSPKPEVYSAPSPKKLDINLADTADLKRIYGIGKVLSDRIVKFRDKLGGFHTMDQLQEVYGLSPEVVVLLKERFYLAADFSPKLIRVNSCEKEELENHPYVSRKTAELIVNYRNNHHPISAEDLMKIPNLSDELRAKLLPYLSFQ